MELNASTPGRRLIGKVADGRAHILGSLGASAATLREALARADGVWEGGFRVERGSQSHEPVVHEGLLVCEPWELEA